EGRGPAERLRARPRQHRRLQLGARSSITVDVFGLLTAGDRYEVRNVQDFYGAPVSQGTYSGGGTIAIPMGGVPAPLPIGRTTPTPPQTGPSFDVFVLLRPAAP